jgi:hypothetical protein
MLTVAAAALAVASTMPSHLVGGTAHLAGLAIFGGLQGVGTGLLSTLCNAIAVRKLGSSVPAAGGALSPVLTAVVAIPVLAEPHHPRPSPRPGRHRHRSRHPQPHNHLPAFPEDLQAPLSPDNEASQSFSPAECNTRPRQIIGRTC